MEQIYVVRAMLDSLQTSDDTPTRHRPKENIMGEMSHLVMYNSNRFISLGINMSHVTIISAI